MRKAARQERTRGERPEKRERGARGGRVLCEYREALKYLAAFAAIFFADRALPFAPLGLSLVFAFSACGGNPLLLAALFALSALAAGSVSYLVCAATGGGVLCAVWAVYRRRGLSMGAESLLYLAVALSLYLGYGGAFSPLSFRLVCAALTVLFSYIALAVCLPFSRRRLQFRPSAMQLLAGGISLVVLGMGVYRFLGGAWLFGIATAALYGFTHFFGGKGALFSATFLLPVGLVEGDLTRLGVFLCYALAVAALRPSGRALSFFAVPALYVFFSLVLSALPFSYAELTAYAAVSLVYLLLPAPLLKRGEVLLEARREKTLTRAAINRDRAAVSARMMHLSSVFREIEALFSLSSAPKADEKRDAALLAEEAMQTVCARCKNHENCIRLGGMQPEDVQKAMAIGISKGRISMLDLPGGLMRACIFPNNLLFGANQLLSRYRGVIADRENAEIGRSLVGAEAGGVAEVLENLSRSCGALYGYDRKKERAVYEFLSERGVFPEEVLVQTDGGVSLVLGKADTARLGRVARRLSAATGVPLVPAEAQEISSEKTMVSFRPAPRFDAAFGIASAKKEGSERSGDTHSMLRLGTDGFMVAISDGMGSGEEANRVSSAALTLIESFYRAGFCSEVVLSTVNRLLSAKAEETFAALDIATVSLSSGRCDFIKIGAPYGFVLKENGVTVVPGNSLPLGILEDVRPEVSADTLAAGDVLVLASDGITDAFASASDFLDYLSHGRERNPQELAESVLKQAKLKSGGVAKDDMTVLCLRLFEKESA